MLWRILEAHRWHLPSDVRVVFANTGKEANATLDFIRACDERWMVPITWVEYRKAPKSKDRWNQVTWLSAARSGEPYAALVTAKSHLPNPVMRFCTTGLKIDPIKSLCKSFGWDEWMTAMGIRADEPRRVAKLRTQADKFAPLAEAGIGLAEVTEFWRAHPFDLELESHNGITPMGNCDLCFLKGPRQILSLIRSNPHLADWWVEQESKIGARFRSDRPDYARLAAIAESHDDLFGFDDTSIADCLCTD